MKDIKNDKYNLLFGRCEDRLKDIPDKSVDFILTDMPYGTTNCRWDSIIDLETTWKEIKRIRKDNTATLLFAQTPFDKVLGVSNIKELRHEWIWEKTQATGYLNAKKMPMKAHENILVFYKKLPYYNPQKTTGHERKVSLGYQRDICIERRQRVHGEDYIYGQETTAPDYDSTERYPRSVQLFSSDKQKSSLHPTQKPVDLLKYFLKTYTKEGDTVLDFTMGSGSTGVACLELDRFFIGIDNEEKWFKVTANRLKQ